MVPDGVGTLELATAIAHPALGRSIGSHLVRRQRWWPSRSCRSCCRGRPDHLCRPEGRQRPRRGRRLVLGAASSCRSTASALFVAAGRRSRCCSASLFVLPIGGADMPVVISLLNSFTGLAAAATGFVLRNDVLIVAGTLVGASGTLLTQMMGRAMNRSLANVLFGAFGGADGGAGADRGRRRGGTVRSSRRRRTPPCCWRTRRRVVIVPGYGLAVAQAQHAVRELADHLEKRRDRREVRHPPRRRPHAGPHERAAGRGRRAVPAALRDGADQPGVRAHRRRARDRRQRRHQPGGARRRRRARSTACRSSRSIGPSRSSCSSARMGTGFAGIDNDALLRAADCSMLFGDAKASLNALVAAVGAL